MIKQGHVMFCLCVVYIQIIYCKVQALHYVCPLFLPSALVSVSVLAVEDHVHSVNV